jgi:hypothetical protein
MAMETRFAVSESEAFPYGVFAFVTTEVEPVRDFEKSTKDNPVQQRDKDTGFPLWSFDVLDQDGRGKNAVVSVKIVSDTAPTLPPVPPGSPIRPVSFEGLTATAYVDQQRCTGKGGRDHRCGAKLAWSFRATGITPPKPPTSAAKPRTDQKPDGQ